MTNDSTLIPYIEKYKLNATCIILVGSRGEGLSTRTSDIDLIIITDKPEKYGVMSNNYAISKENGTKYEVLIITKNDMERLIKEAFKNNDFYFLQKIIFGEVLFGECGINREALKKSFRSNYYIKNTDQALKMYSALEGIKSDCHLQQYAFSLKKYMVKIAEIYLFVGGDNYIKSRWLMSRLIRREGEYSDLLKAFFTAINISITNKTDIEELECQVMTITALMLYKAILEGDKIFDIALRLRNIRFFAMEREGKIVLFCGKDACLVGKEKARMLIENMMLEQA